MSFTTGDFGDLALYQTSYERKPTAPKWTSVAGVVVGSGALATLCTIGAMATAGFVSASLSANHSLVSFSTDSPARTEHHSPFGTLASSAKFFAIRSAQTYKSTPEPVGLRGTIQGPEGFPSATTPSQNSADAGVTPAVKTPIVVAQSATSAPLPPRSIRSRLDNPPLENPPLPPVRDAFAAIANVLEADASRLPPAAAQGGEALPATPPLPPVRTAAAPASDRLAALEPAESVVAPQPPHREISLVPDEAVPPARPAARLTPAAPPPVDATRQTEERPTVAPPAPAPAAAAPGDKRNIFQRFFAALQQPNEPSNGVFGGPLPGDYGTLSADGHTAIYDISTHTVYLPDGERLEAHSGLGNLLDDPSHVNSKDRGATPPHLYDLQLRGQLFHGVQALRLNPVGQGAMYGRVGLLAHTYMLGPRGDSNGCVSFKQYPRFLQAYVSGQVQRLAVVTRLGGGTAPATIARPSTRRGMKYAATQKDGRA
jgi:hypothetical protein